MSDSGFMLLVEVLAMGFLLFYEGYKRMKAEKRNKQLEADYNELLKQVVVLTNENTKLKKRSTDMI